MSRPQSVRQRDAWPLLMLLHTRLNRMAARFATLAALAANRTAAGPPPQRPIKPGRKGQPPGARDSLPRSVGWLIRLLPHEAACYGSQLQHLMSGPEMAALLEAVPQVGRILRPLCRMLAIEPTASIRPALSRPRAVSAPAVRPRPPTPSETSERADDNVLAPALFPTPA